jgi:hypothetical protein
MDERRFRTALDTITETIADYGEDTIVAAFRVILERFDYEVVKRDPGPDCCDYGRYYADKGIMHPIHECPSERPDAWIDDLSDAGKAVVTQLLGGKR